jgi:hypothetical protein
VLHAELEKACRERHAAIDLERDTVRREFRELFNARAQERAWAILGKIAVGLAASYAALEKILSAIQSKGGAP